MRLLGRLEEYIASVFRKDGQDITLRPNQAHTYTGAGDLDYQLPAPETDGDGMTTLVSEKTPQTLESKTIDGDVNTVQDLALSSLKTEAAEANQFVLRDGLGAVVDDKTVPTGDVVGSSDAQTLTNKSIDADANTITNIEDADIKAAAAIDATKIADGSVDNTEFQRLGAAGGGAAGDLVTTDGTQTLTNKTVDGTTNTVQNLDTASVTSGTFADARIAASNVTQHEASVNHNNLLNGSATTGVHGVTGSVVGTTDTQNLSNKTLVNPVVDDFADLEDLGAEPATPASGFSRLFVQASALRLKDDAGVVTSFGAGLASLNLQTGSTQSFAVGTSGTDFNISSVSDIHTFNIPDASITARGLVTTGAQTFGGNKIFNNDVTVSGDLTVNGTTTTINTTIQATDQLVVTNTGTDVAARVNQQGTGNILEVQDNGTNVLTVADGGTVSAANPVEAPGFINDVSTALAPAVPDDIDIDVFGNVLQFNTSGASRTLTGLNNGVAGEVVYVIKRDSANSLTIQHLAGGVAVGDQFLLPGGVDLVITDQRIVVCVKINNFWYVTGT